MGRERLLGEGRECLEVNEEPFPRTTRRPSNGQRSRFTLLTKLFSIVSFVLLGISVFPLEGLAAGTLETPTAQLKVGTLPLLAALGVGIAVAVGAVIAFLQMTAKGNAANGSSLFATHDDELFEDTPTEDWDEEQPVSNSEYDDNPLTDYTIPITKLLTYPNHVEAAEPDEPSLCGVKGEHSGSCYRILNRQLSIGRDPAQCVILFPYEAGQISRLHCTLRFIEESRVFVLEDHGSSNGTFLADGQRLQPGKSYELQAGQRFSICGGEHWFEVRDGRA